MKPVYKVLDVSLTLLKTNPPQLSITAHGSVRSSGWKDGTLEPRVYTGGQPQDGMLDFDFVANPPTDTSQFRISPIFAEAQLPSIPGWLKGVRVHAETNRLESPLQGAKQLTLD